MIACEDYRQTQNLGIFMTGTAEPRGPSILVVDDERVIADSLARILTLSGCAAVPAYSAESAIESALRTSPELLISDIVMTGMNGIDLAIKLQHIAPQCKVILSSGQPVSAQLLDLAGREGWNFAFLHKPIHPAQLLTYVSKIIYRPNRSFQLREAQPAY